MGGQNKRWRGSENFVKFNKRGGGGKGGGGQNNV